MNVHSIIIKILKYVCPVINSLNFDLLGIIINLNDV